MTVGAGGGVIGYASVDEDFRRTVEETLPGSDQVLDMIIGEKTAVKPVSAPPPVTAAPSKLRISSPVMVTQAKEEAPAPPAPETITEDKKEEPPKPIEEPKKEEQEPVEAVEEVKTEEPIIVVSSPPPPLEKPQEMVEEKTPAEEVKSEEVKVEEVKETPVEVSEPVKVVEDEPMKEEVSAAPEAPATAPDVPVAAPEAPAVAAVIEPSHDIENRSLELMLGELCQEMQDTVNATVEDFDAAAKAVHGHMELMEKVLESNLSAKDETAWNDMFVAAQKKSDSSRTAENSEKRARAAIANVVASIAAGRKNKITSTNPKLLAAEEAANKSLYKLDQAKVKRASAESEAKVMEGYRDLVEASKEEFHKEMASIMPDVELGEKNGKLTESELNMFITHAYRKVMFLQQELAKQQTLEQERFRKALEKQRMETTSLAVDQLDSELEKQARELNVEHERKLAALKEEAETELRVQMKRQAAAHADHITDVLTVQEAEIVRKLGREHQDNVEALSSKYTESLAKLAGVVGGLKGGLEARAGADEASHGAQSLWVASSQLNALVSDGNLKAESWDQKLAPLSDAVNTVQTVAGDQDSFVKTLVSSIPGVALERGVYTEDSLKERFIRVETVARKVAGVGEQGGSLMQFAMSYLQSKLLVDLTKRAPVESLEVVDLDTVTSLDLISLARHNLDRGDLGRAVQLLTQLRGESGRVVADWLSEARLTLETQQAVSAIMAHSLVRSCNNMIAN